MKKNLLLFLVIALFTCFYACTHKPAKLNPVLPKDTTSNNNNTDSNKAVIPDTTKEVADTSVCFQRDVLPIFTGSCVKTGCHNSATKAKGYDLSYYGGIIAKGLAKGNALGSKLYTECTSGKMPVSPTPALDSTQLSFIKRWINMGAPDDSNCAVNCDTTKYTFSGAINPILTTYCYSCHTSAASASSGGGVTLDNYNAVFAQAQTGRLLGDLQHLPGHNYMPLGGAQLSDCKITQFRKWIDAGALNN